MKKYAKDWLVWGTAIIGLIIIAILVIYFVQAGNSFVSGQADWGEFGSLLGAIAGLVAFIGVLFTLRQNKQQSLNSDERSVFFELLNIFISYRDAMQVKKEEWSYNELPCHWDIHICDDFCTSEGSYQQIYVQLCRVFYIQIWKSIPNNMNQDEFIKYIIPEHALRKNVSDVATWEPIADAVKWIYLEYEHSKGEIAFIETKQIRLNTYDYICIYTIKWYLEHENYKPIAEAYAKASDICFASNMNQLGPYFRNAYYILEIISEFNSPNNYSKIFRAQLSKYELTILFFNSFGSRSTPRTQELYLAADLFNNLALKDVYLKEARHDEYKKQMDFINFPFHLSPDIDEDECVACAFLKKLYDSVGKK